MQTALTWLKEKKRLPVKFTNPETEEAAIERKAAKALGNLQDKARSGRLKLNDRALLDEVRSNLLITCGLADCFSTSCR